LKDQRYFNTIFPLHDTAGAKIALLNLKMSVKVTDDLTRQTLIISGIILIITLLIIIALLMINTRLFEFAILFNKLKEIDQMKDEFISMASHELRSPITAIKGYVSMFADGSFGVISEQGKKSVAIIESSIRRLADLVEDLLDVSRIEQNRLQVTPEETNLNEIISMTVDEMAVSAQAKKITLSYPTKGESLPTVSADKDKLRQVLVNLIGNAIKYTPAGSVLVTAQPQPDDKYLIIRVKDSGIGMSAQEREELFNKFYRIKNESTKGIIGTGLGLWITKQLVNLMGGEIYVDSIVGTGTEFSFTIPVFTKPAKTS
jgi:signal transduction histidine kinase